jgi:hypothetical protein
LFSPGRSLILPQIRFLLNNLSFFCGRIRDDNEFKGETGEGSSGDSINYDEITIESPLLPSPYPLNKRVIPNESTLDTFPKPLIVRWMNEGSPRVKPISIFYIYLICRSVDQSFIMEPDVYKD